ncbi:MAG: sugar transferase [Dermatophilaceae bacterium]
MREESRGRTTLARSGIWGASAHQVLLHTERLTSSLYTAEQACSHEVRPGVAGLAQVSGRNSLSWEDKLGLDMDYVDERSLGGDLTDVAGGSGADRNGREA